MTTPTDCFHRLIDNGTLDYSYPYFRDEMFEVIAECIAKGCIYVATEGYRSMVRSDQLSDSGIVAAPGGQSAHNFGLAFDFIRVAGGDPRHVQPSDLELPPIYYSVLGEVALKHGQDWGGAWKHKKGDYGHVGLVGFVNAEQLAPLRAIEQAPDEPLPVWLARVWATVDMLRTGAVA